MHRLSIVLDKKAPLITSSSKLQAKNAPRTNSFRLGWGLCNTQDKNEPSAKRTTHMRFEASVSPNVRLRETIESESKALMMKVIKPEDANMATKTTSATATGNTSSTTRGARRKMLQSVRRMERVEKEGRTKRWR